MHFHASCITSDQCYQSCRGPLLKSCTLLIRQIAKRAARVAAGRSRQARSQPPTQLATRAIVPEIEACTACTRRKQHAKACMTTALSCSMQTSMRAAAVQQVQKTRASHTLHREQAPASLSKTHLLRKRKMEAAFQKGAAAGLQKEATKCRLHLPNKSFSHCQGPCLHRGLDHQTREEEDGKEKVVKLPERSLSVGFRHECRG